MGREDCVAVGVRLFAIFLLVIVLRTFAGMFVWPVDDDTTARVVLAGGVAVVGSAVCALLWFFPLTIARKLLPVMSEPRSERAMDGPVALAVGLTLLGVWVLTSALTDAIYWATFLVVVRRDGSALFAWEASDVANMVGTVVQLVLALWLIFGSVGIRRLIHRYRYGSLEGVD